MITTTQPPTTMINTTTQPSSCEIGSSCSCMNGVCTYNMSVIISSSVTITEDIIFLDDVTIESNVVVSIPVGVSISVNGVLRLNGTLSLINVNMSGIVNVISSSSTPIGLFNNVLFSNSSIEGCNDLKGEQIVNGNDLSILVSTNCGLSTGALIGIIVGSIVGGIIIAFIILLIWKRERIKLTSMGNENAKNNTVTELNRAKQTMQNEMNEI